MCLDASQLLLVLAFDLLHLPYKSRAYRTREKSRFIIKNVSKDCLAEIQCSLCFVDFHFHCTDGGGGGGALNA